MINVDTLKKIIFFLILYVLFSWPSKYYFLKPFIENNFNGILFYVNLYYVVLFLNKAGDFHTPVCT